MKKHVIKKQALYTLQAAAALNARARAVLLLKEIEGEKGGKTRREKKKKRERGREEGEGERKHALLGLCAPLCPSNMRTPSNDHHRSLRVCALTGSKHTAARHQSIYHQPVSPVGNHQISPPYIVFFILRASSALYSRMPLLHGVTALFSHTQIDLATWSMSRKSWLTSTTPPSYLLIASARLSIASMSFF